MGPYVNSGFRIKPGAQVDGDAWLIISERTRPVSTVLLIRGVFCNKGEGIALQSEQLLLELKIILNPHQKFSDALNNF